MTTHYHESTYYYPSETVREYVSDIVAAALAAREAAIADGNKLDGAVPVWSDIFSDTAISGTIGHRLKHLLAAHVFLYTDKKTVGEFLFDPSICKALMQLGITDDAPGEDQRTCEAIIDNIELGFDIKVLKRVVSTVLQTFALNNDIDKFEQAEEIIYRVFGFPEASYISRMAIRACHSLPRSGLYKHDPKFEETVESAMVSDTLLSSIMSTQVTATYNATVALYHWQLKRLKAQEEEEKAAKQDPTYKP